MKDNCSYRFDAILAVALEQDARQELAALPTPAALKELYPDTSSLDARITRALHTLHHSQKALHRALAAVLLAAALLAGTLAVSAEARRAVYTAILHFCPLKPRSPTPWTVPPLDALPENYCDHYVPEGFVLDEESELRDSYQFFRSYHSADNQIYFIDCVIINDSFISTFDNEHTVWQETNVNDCPATLGTTTIQGHVSHALIWEKRRYLSLHSWGTLSNRFIPCSRKHFLKYCILHNYGVIF